MATFVIMGIVVPDSGHIDTNSLGDDKEWGHKNDDTK